MEPLATFYACLDIGEEAEKKVTSQIGAGHSREKYSKEGVVLHLAMDSPTCWVVVEGLPGLDTAVARLWGAGWSSGRKALPEMLKQHGTD